MVANRILLIESMPAERADDSGFFTVQDGDVVSERMKQRCMVSTIKPDLHPTENPYEDFSKKLRLAVARLFLFGHAFLLAQKESPAGTITSRAMVGLI